MAVCVGDGGQVAVFIIGVPGLLSSGAYFPYQAVHGIVGVGGGLSHGIGLGGLVSFGIVGAAGPAAVVFYPFFDVSQGIIRKLRHLAGGVCHLPDAVQLVVGIGGLVA